MVRFRTIMRGNCRGFPEFVAEIPDGRPRLPADGASFFSRNVSGESQETRRSGKKYAFRFLDLHRAGSDQRQVADWAGLPPNANRGFHEAEATRARAKQGSLSNYRLPLKTMD